MAAPKKTFDMDAVSKDAITHIQGIAQSGQRVTVEGVVAAMVAAGSVIAPTRLAVLIKALSDSNDLGGFYLRRGKGLVHEDADPRPKKVKKVVKAKKAKKAPKKAKRATVTPDTLALEIDRQEEAAALEEFRAQCREKHRKALGLAC